MSPAEGSRVNAGMWYSMALFYDSGELGPAYATVAMATAVASVLGGPIAACLLMLNGVAGLHGWQASPTGPHTSSAQSVWDTAEVMGLTSYRIHLL